MPQSQIIVTSRYLKSGTQKSKNKRRNYTKYIATRETVEVRDQNTIDRNDNATKNQQELLRDLLSDFPEAKKYLEYEDYIAAPTVENASELISTIIERNADIIGNRQKEALTVCLMKKTNRSFLTELQTKLQITRAMSGRTLFLLGEKTLFVLVMTTLRYGEIL